jgi:2-dehydro-3-deoxyphosphogluconate aldolase/(4S)-4-hydroxy-2-oxoglutarate aldolase
MDSRASILDQPLIGILRGISHAQLAPLLGAVAEGGLRNIEVTMNSPGATGLIAEARRFGRSNVGAGTVIDCKVLDAALGAGASFIVTPLFHREVVEECVRRAVPVFPGALSPSEIYEAWEIGATMVKVFPADTGGPDFIRALRGPFPKIRLLPTGGIDLSTAPAYLRAGAAGLGVGSPLFDRSRIMNGDWEWLRERTRQFVALFPSGQKRE